MPSPPSPVACTLFGVAIEPLRTDRLFIGPMPAAFWLRLLLVAVGIGGVLLRHGRRSGPLPAPTSGETT